MVRSTDFIVGARMLRVSHRLRRVLLFSAALTALAAPAARAATEWWNDDSIWLLDEADMASGGPQTVSALISSMGGYIPAAVTTQTWLGDGSSGGPGGNGTWSVSTNWSPNT